MRRLSLILFIIAFSPVDMLLAVVFTIHRTIKNIVLASEGYTIGEIQSKVVEEQLGKIEANIKGKEE